MHAQRRRQGIRGFGLCALALSWACGGAELTGAAGGMPEAEMYSGGGEAEEGQSYHAMSGVSEEAVPAPTPSATGGGRGVAAKSRSADAASDAVRPAAAAVQGNDGREVELSLIYDATVHLAVFEAEAALDAAERLGRDNGGYLVRRTDLAIQFRVPAARFHAVLADVLKLGDVLHRVVSVRDVTDELHDLRTRLRNAEATRDRLEQLLARAQKVEEALQVERELNRVAGEVEQLKGRLKLLQELVAFSTISLQFQPRAVDQVESRVRLPFPWLERLGLTELLQL